MGLPNEFYRISMANAKFSLCSTYPQILAVLKCVSDAYLVKGMYTKEYNYYFSGGI